jgi:hypothetical protein
VVLAEAAQASLLGVVLELLNKETLAVHLLAHLVAVVVVQGLLAALVLLVLV